MTLSDLKPLAEQNLPTIQFAGSTPEERMLSGFLLAKQHMAKLLPQGHSVDVGAAIATQESYEKQLVERKSVVSMSLAAKQDLPEDSGIQEIAEKSREYWISMYALAAEGIGAYATGYARKQVEYGLLSEQDYLDSVDLRTKSFSTIVYAGQTGYLPQLVVPNDWYSASMQNSEAARTMMLSGQLRGGGRVTLGTAGTKIMALDKTRNLVPVQLGDPTIALIIAGAVVIALVGIAVVSAVAWQSVEKTRIQASAEFMGQMCKQADKNPELTKACTQYADTISQATPMPFGLDNLSKYLVWGGVGLAAFYLLPNIVKRWGGK
jgi:hypothetical protein